MVTPLMLVWISAAIVSHYFFHKREPTAISFLLAVSAVFSLEFLFFSVVQRCGLMVTFFMVLRSLAFYLSSLSISIVAYRLSPWHPLAHYPGPILARVSKWWMVYIIFAGGRHKVLQHLHSNYGIWVRVGPNELSVNLHDAIHPIYLNLSRASYYKGIPASANTLITLVDKKEHSKRRRPWTKALSRHGLPGFASQANIRILQFVHILHQKASKQPVDLHHWLSLLLMDMIGDMAFSGGFETMAAADDVDGWMKTLNLGAAVVAVLGQVPWLRDIVALLPQKGPIETFHSFAREKVRQAKANQTIDGVKNNILSVVVNENHHGAKLTEQEAAADASLLIASSVETTSQAITTLFRYVAADKVIFNRLRAEIDMVAVDDDEIDPSLLTELTYLDACVHEALRIVPPAPAGPPRTTGEGGAFIVNQYIPSNTTVSVPTWTMHRDPSNFFRPDAFIPERWLRAGPTILPHNPETYIPFSVGYGACVGRQLALQNIKLIVCHLVRRFSIDFPIDFSLHAFDDSYKERSLWVHQPFMVELLPRKVCV